MSTDEKTTFVLYHYDPSFPAEVVFIALFGITSAAQLFLMVRNRTWYFIPFLIGCLFEAVGYVGRAIAAKQSPDWTTTPYIMQSLLLLLGPTLLAASIYMVLARLIQFLDADAYSIIRTRWLTKVFVIGDVISFLAQGAGGGMLAKAKTSSDQNLGTNIILAGLAVQVVFFGFFIATTVIFHVRISRRPTTRSYSVTAPWRQFVLALYASSAFIMVRSIYRMAEYAQGWDGALQSKEVYLLVLDGALMFLVTAVFAWYHPSRVLCQDGGYKDVNRGSQVELGLRGREGAPAREAMLPVVHGAEALHAKPYDGPHHGPHHGQAQTTYDPYGYARTAR